MIKHFKDHHNWNSSFPNIFEKTAILNKYINEDHNMIGNIILSLNDEDFDK